MCSLQHMWIIKAKESCTWETNWHAAYEWTWLWRYKNLNIKNINIYPPTSFLCLGAKKIIEIREKKFIFWRYVTTHLGYGITASSRKLLVNFFAFDFATTKESGKKTRHWSQSNQYCWYLSQICFQSSKIFSRSR